MSPGGGGFEGDDDRLGTGIKCIFELGGSAGPTVKGDVEAVRDELFDAFFLWWPTGESVEIGDVEGVDAVAVAEGFGDDAGIGGVQAEGLPGLVIRALSADGANDLATEKIEDADPGGGSEGRGKFRHRGAFSHR